ncbi:MAG TPA: GNAT family N-acetyltransferase [Bacteroidia bacterium]|jgi:RimJ/RimL family protein N-acetyltransferase|nr:GNAT family N-acetyltransferase [Bacteroidia bacterium]
MNFEFQPTLENETVRICPLLETDFETLYKIASDPLIWEQHPNPNRYQKEVFQTFFKGAIESGGAFLVFDNKTEEAIGSSRYCEYNPEEQSISIGYTFLARDHWGGLYNPALKALMLDHAFRFVNRVIFHIGAVNVRSQKAIEKLGALKTGEAEIEYYGEAPKRNFIYCIDKENWRRKGKR